jgi:DNA repair protein RadC
MRITKYKTKLTETNKAVLEKEYSVNCPEIDRKMNSPEKVHKLATHFLRMHEESEEYMYMVCTNVKLELISVFEISHGNVNSSIVGVREVFQKALLANAVSIFLMHNHPSGDPTPSREDIQITKRLVEAGDLLGVQVLDHLIIGRPGYTSLKEKGYI